MLMQRIHIALSGLLSPKLVHSVMIVSDAAAVLSWQERKFFWMLWNINFLATPFRNNGAERRRIRRTLFDGRQDGTKVVVHEDHVRGFLRDVRPTLAHRYPNIRHFKRQRVVNCSTSTQHAHQNHKTNKQKMVGTYLRRRSSPRRHREPGTPLRSTSCASGSCAQIRSRARRATQPE